MVGATSSNDGRPMTTPAPHNPDSTRPANDLDAHWRDTLEQAPYYKAGYTFDDYAPAYRAGRDARAKAGGKSWAEAENALRADWHRLKGGSRLSWEEASAACQAAWFHETQASVPPSAT